MSAHIINGFTTALDLFLAGMVVLGVVVVVGVPIVMMVALYNWWQS